MSVGACVGVRLHEGCERSSATAWRVCEGVEVYVHIETFVEKYVPIIVCVSSH